MRTQAKTVDAYLAKLPEDRRAALERVRAVILKNLPKGYAEGIQYGAIGYFVPHDVYPPGYHCDSKQPLPFGGLASQKNHMSLYLMCIYNEPEHKQRFIDEWRRTGKKLDMGASCIRFKKLEDLPLDVIGRAVKRVPVKKFIEHYENAIKAGGKRTPKKRPSTKKTVKKAASKKTATARSSPRKTVRKKTATKKTKKATTKKPASKKVSRVSKKKVTKRSTAKKSGARKKATTARTSGGSKRSTKKTAARTTTKRKTSSKKKTTGTTRRRAR